MTTLIRNFSADFGKLVQNQPDAVAFIVNRDLNSAKVTYAELDALISRTQVFLAKTLKPGDVVNALMPNSLETLVVFLACIRGGYHFAPLACTASRQEVEKWIGLTKPKLCITTEAITDHARDVVSASSVPTVYVDCDTAFSWLPESGSTPESAEGARVYLSTSGTTGEPKAIVLDCNTLWSSGYAFMDHHGLKGRKLRFWNYLPMSYLGGLFNLALIPLCIGGSAVIDEPFSGKTFLRFWQTIVRYDIDVVWFVPTIVRGLLKLAERTDSEDIRQGSERLHTCFLGTAPLDLATKTKFEKTFHIKLIDNFGLSETTFFSSETRNPEDARFEGSVGKTLRYTDVKFAPVSEDDGSGEEILVRSPFLFKGYLDQNGDINTPFDTDGYMPTGDLGHINDDGLLVITGRKRDIIKKGGYFVALREIEIALESHPDVLEAAAVKIPHDFYGESYNLYAVLKSPEDNNVQALNAYIHNNVVSYKWPEKIIVIDSLPRTASGKVKKHMLGEGAV